MRLLHRGPNKAVSIAAAILSLMILWQVDGRAQEKGKLLASGPIAKLYAAAKKEGKVVMWGPTDLIVFQKAQEVFDKEYPGIKIEVFESLPDPLVQRLIAESQAGKPSNVDLIQSGSMRGLRPLIERDMLSPYPGWETDFKLDAVYAGGRFAGAYNLSFPICYNTKLVPAQEAPKNWEDLLNPKWKGRKIIVEARLVPFAMLGTEWGKDKAIEWTKKLMAQEPILVQGGTTVGNALASGQAPIAVGTYGYTIEKLKKTGAPVDWVAVNPLLIITSALGVPKTAPHPNAGRFLAGWLGTSEGQKILYEYSGNAMLMGRNAFGVEAEKIKAAGVRILLETDQNSAAIVGIQGELGKLIGALR